MCKIYYRLFGCSLFLLSGLMSSSYGAPLNALRRSVFKVEVESQQVNFAEPWRYHSPTKSRGTGFYIGDRYILTNAHVVSNGRFIKVQRDGDPEPVAAYLKFIAHDADLAIVTTDVPDYFVKSKPLKFGGNPRLQAPVSAVGFPTGGDQISVTKGVISRIDARVFVHTSDDKHLLIQVDSAMNPGNSGGPVFQGNRVIGVSFQSNRGAQSTGYIIPIPVVKRFLKDIEDGHYDGHPRDGIWISPWALRNEATRLVHGLKAEDGGVKIAYINPRGLTHHKLKEGDVILAIDGRAIGVDGRIEYHGERVDYQVLFDLKQVGDTAIFRISRDRKIIDVPVVVEPKQAQYYAGNIFPRHPRFIIYGGLVFTVMSRNLLTQWGGGHGLKNISPMLKYSHIMAPFDPRIAQKHEQIVLANKLPLAVNAYVENKIQSIVSRVNGIDIVSFQQLVEVLDQKKEGYTFIDFEGDRDPIVVDARQAHESIKKVEEDYGIRLTRWLANEKVDGGVFQLQEVSDESRL